MIDSENPFASPLTGERAADVPETEAERIRHEHLSAEVTCKQVGLLCYLGGCAATIYSVLLFILGASEWARLGFEAIQLPALAGFVVGAGLLAMLAWLQFGTGYGLRRLHPASRSRAILLSVLWLLYVPLGTLVGGHFLWLMNSARGKYVFMPEYKQVIEQTPHIKYKTSIVVWIFVGLVVFVIMLAVIAWLASRA